MEIKRSNQDNRLVRMSSIIHDLFKYLDTDSLLNVTNSTKTLLNVKHRYLKRIYTYFTTTGFRNNFALEILYMGRKTEVPEFLKYKIEHSYNDELPISKDYDTELEHNNFNLDMCKLIRIYVEKTYKDVYFPPMPCFVFFSHCNCAAIIRRYFTFIDNNWFCCMKLLSPKFMSNFDALKRDEKDIRFFVLHNFEKLLNVFLSLMNEDCLVGLIDDLPCRDCSDHSNRHIFDSFVNFYKMDYITQYRKRWQSLSKYKNFLYKFSLNMDYCGFIDGKTNLICGEMANRINRDNTEEMSNILSYRCDQCSDENNWTEETVQEIFDGKSSPEEFTRKITVSEYNQYVDSVDQSSHLTVYEEMSKEEFEKKSQEIWSVYDLVAD